MSDETLDGQKSAFSLWISTKEVVDRQTDRTDLPIRTYPTNHRQTPVLSRGQGNLSLNDVRLTGFGLVRRNSIRARPMLAKPRSRSGGAVNENCGRVPGKGFPYASDRCCARRVKPCHIPTPIMRVGSGSGNTGYRNHSTGIGNGGHEARGADRFDGERAVDTVIDQLVRLYEAPREVIAGDVIKMLQDLVDKGVLQAYLWANERRQGQS
jgi:Coenzyme PQQ synthesis protein D (PqqD)